MWHRGTTPRQVGSHGGRVQCDQNNYFHRGESDGVVDESTKKLWVSYHFSIVTKVYWSQEVGLGGCSH